MTTSLRGSGVDHVCWLSELRALVDAADQALYEVAERRSAAWLIGGGSCRRR
jgi:hypothetical protein